MTNTPVPNTPAARQVVKDEAAATARYEPHAEPQAHAPKKEEPKVWVADLTDNQFPPWHEQNRGNVDFKPCCTDAPSSEAGLKALKAMVTGDYKLPAGTYDNITGNPAFQAPNVMNPPWRWDASSRQTQWVRP